MSSKILRFIQTIALLISSLLINKPSRAQDSVPNNTSFEGIVVGPGHKPLNNALVTAMTADTATKLLQAVLSGADGRFSMRLPRRTPVKVSVNLVGFTTLSVQFQSVDTLLVPYTFALEEATQQLQEVQVIAQKLPFDIQADRVVVNVADNPIFSGGSVIDVLSKTPRVLTDENAKSVLVNQMPAQVLIQNGRQLPFTGNQIHQYLLSLPASSIQKIEVITAASAKYDAAGGGVIVLTTIPSTTKGLTGDGALSAGSGIYPRGNGSLSLTWRHQKWSVNALYSGTARRSFWDYTTKQRLLALLPNQQEGYSDARTRHLYTYLTHNLRLTTQYTLSSKTVLGVVLYGTQARHFTDGVTNLAYQVPAPGAPDVILRYTNQITNRHMDWTANANLQHAFSDKRTLSADVDYAAFTLNNNNVGSYTTLAGNKPVERLQLQQPGWTSIATAKADYQQTLSNGTLEAGAKISHVSMRSRPFVGQYTPAFTPLLVGLTRPVDYRERTLAAYANRNWTLGKVAIQTGLRIEQTAYETVSNDSLLSQRTYTEVFPNALISWTSSKEAEWSISYNRRIVRPVFDVLSPAVTYLDPITLLRGNPLLAPELAQIISLTRTDKKGRSVQVSYSVYRQGITEVIFRSDSTSAQVLNSYLNFDSDQRLQVSIDIPLTLTKHWNLQTNVTGFYTNILSTFRDVPTRQEQAGASLQLTSVWNWNTWRASVQVNGQTPFVEGFMRYRPAQTVSLGLQRSVFSRQGTLKLAVSDVFYSYFINNYGRYLNTDINLFQRFDSRRAMLTFTYRFGNLKLKELDERGFSSEDEQNRVRRSN